jgi:hypothetical protein
LLSKLTDLARSAGIAVDEAALVFEDKGQMNFYGSRELILYLAGGWTPTWTHVLFHRWTFTNKATMESADVSK